MSYEIRVVSNEEFDSLPYKRAKSSLGLADAKNRIAYVRETGIRDLDESTISHEFDELLMKVSPHEEDGIRYKSGGALGSILGPVVGSLLSLINPALGAVVGAGISSGTSQYSKTQKPEKYGEPGKIGDILLSAGTGAAGAYGGGKALSGFGKGWTAASDLGKNALMGGLKGAVGVGTSAAETPAMSLLEGGVGNAAGQPLGAPAMSLATGGIGTASGQALSSGSPAMSLISGGVGTASGAPVTGAAPAGQSLLSKYGDFGKSALKTASSDVGKNALSALSPQADTQQSTLYPENRTPAGGTAQYGTAGAVERFNPSLLGQSYTPISQKEYDLGLTNLGTAKQTKLDELFKTPAFRGQTPEENSRLAQQLSSINTGFNKELEQYNLDVSGANLSREYNAVKQANKISNEEMNKYIELAQKSDAEIAKMVANKPDEFRKIFGHLKPITV